MFQTNQGPSFPAHQFLLSGTSAPDSTQNPDYTYFAAENPYYTINGINPADDAGCAALTGQMVPLVSPTQDESTKKYQRPHSFHLLQPRHLRITPSGDLLDLPGENDAKACIKTPASGNRRCKPQFYKHLTAGLRHSNCTATWVLPRSCHVSSHAVA